MKKIGIINSEIASVVASMGHMDWISIGDAGMPVPDGVKKIDLALDNAIPSFEQVLTNILKEMEVQHIYLAEEIKEQNPTQLTTIQKILPNIPITFISHTQLKKKLSQTKAFIRTGEMTPFSNIILESGVTF